jgi:twitching motility protein PilT
MALLDEVPLTRLLSALLRVQGSDLLLAAGYPPAIRVHGEMMPVDSPPLEPEKILLPTEMARLAAEQSLDFAYETEVPEQGRYRFRGNAYYQRFGLSALFRIIPWQVPTLEELNLPAQVRRLGNFDNGLVLVTGTSGAGKSTTLAALVRFINESRPVHIVTIEDPIEYVHQNKRALVIQRQVFVHVESFSRALRAALREDPDVILVGEMRDVESIQIALTAAETGHLVLGTLHTVSAAQTISRIVHVFQGSQQQQIRTQLADTLRGVVSQQLLPRRDGRGLVPAVEVLLCNEAVANVMREGRLHQITSLMEAGASKGMQLMDQDLKRLVNDGLVDPMEAYSRAHDKGYFASLIGLAEE